jgi:hypothetical protein
MYLSKEAHLNDNSILFFQKLHNLIFNHISNILIFLIFTIYRITAIRSLAMIPHIISSFMRNIF